MAQMAYYYLFGNKAARVSFDVAVCVPVDLHLAGCHLEALGSLLALAALVHRLVLEGLEGLEGLGHRRDHHDRHGHRGLVLLLALADLVLLACLVDLAAQLEVELVLE